jgi:hypothetical protein
VTVGKTHSISTFCCTSCVRRGGPVVVGVVIVVVAGAGPLILGRLEDALDARWAESSAPAGVIAVSTAGDQDELERGLQLKSKWRRTSRLSRSTTTGHRQLAGVEHVCIHDCYRLRFIMHLNRCLLRQNSARQLLPSSHDRGVHTLLLPQRTPEDSSTLCCRRRRCLRGRPFLGLASPSTSDSRRCRQPSCS